MRQLRRRQSTAAGPPSAKASDDRIAPPPRGEGGSGGVLSSASDDDGGGFQSAIRAERAWRARQSNPDISNRQADATEDPPRARQSDEHLDAPPTRSRPVDQGHRHQLLQLTRSGPNRSRRTTSPRCPRCESPEGPGAHADFLLIRLSHGHFLFKSSIASSTSCQSSSEVTSESVKRITAMRRSRSAVSRPSGDSASFEPSSEPSRL